MVPDVIELDELRTGERREGSFFSIFILFEKVSTGVTLAVSNYAIGLSGFESYYGTDTQPKSAILTLRLLVGVIPTFILLISWVACYFYPITKKLHSETVKQLILARDLDKRLVNNKQ